VRWRRKKTPTSPTADATAPDAQAPEAGIPAAGTPAAAGPVAAGAEQDDSQVLRDLNRVVEQFGWAVLHGGGAPGDPRWSHTVGLTGLGHPEVIVMGLPFEAGETYLNLVGEAVRAGARFTPGTTTTALTDADSPVVFLAVSDTGRLAVAEQFYGSVEALQLVWPDSAGTLPWEDGHRNPPQAQPLLGPRPDA
jgi:hypothetical protein